LGLVFDRLSRQVDLVYTVANLPGGLKAALVATALCSVVPETVLVDDADDYLCGSERPPDGTCSICHYPAPTDVPTQRAAWGPAGGKQALQKTTDRHGAQGVPSGMSLFCLSCHDGVMAPQPPNTSAGLPIARTIGVEPGRRSGHHPYSIEYPAGTNPDFPPPRNNRVGPLPLYSYPGSADLVVRIECPTCHTVHEGAADHLLRVTDERGELCVYCHGVSPRESATVYAQLKDGRSAPDGTSCLDCHRK
jgi:predicted CXXCH cytochrome family protein